MRWIPGVALSLLAAAAGWGIHALAPVIPWLTASLALGVIVGCFPAFRRRQMVRPGLAISSRRLLRLGIVALGLKLSLVDIARLGWLTIVAIVALVGLSFGVTYLIARLFRLEGDQPVLLAAGFSICGVSAVGAMQAARGSKDADAATPIALVTLCGTAAIAVLPALAPLLGLSGGDFGRWVGASVHDVGQVVATASVGGAAVLAAAIVVKLTRVLMLAPMVAIASLGARRSNPATAGKRPPIVPLFIAGFVVALVVRTLVPLPHAVLSIADVAQSVLLASALFAIGASLRLESLARSGLRSLGAGLVAWVVILGLGYAFVRLR
ncbi:putative sulfate exporter family transporter [soil metagenome]